MNRVASIHWGFSIGGVGKYATIIDSVSEYSDIDIYSIVILMPSAHVDEKTMGLLSNLEVIRLKSKLDVSWLWKLRGCIKKSKSKLLMTHGFNGHFLVMVQKYLLFINLPAVCSYHGKYHSTTPFRKLLGVVFNLLTEFYIRHCVKGAIAVAEYCRNYLSTVRVDISKVEVIHNGIKDNVLGDNKRDELRKEWGVEKGELLLGVASRIDPVKGIEYLMDAFLGASKSDDNVKLVIIGTGTLDASLSALVKKNNLDSRVIFTGFRSDIDDCLAAMDIFILPSLAEYHSIALLEAMRAGKPIISSNVGGNTESVRDMKEALIVPPADSKAIEVAINTMINDSSLRDRLSRCARERFLECFTEDKTIKKTADWLVQFVN